MFTKVKTTTFIFIIFALLIVLQLARWQIVDYNKWKVKADDKVSIQKIPSQRGAIVTRDGTVLAIDEKVFGLYLNTRSEYVKDLKALAEKLSGPLNMSTEDILKKTSNPNANYFSIAHELSSETIDKVKKLEKELKPNVAVPGAIIISSEVKRVHPNNELAAHVIGYTEHSEDYKELIGRYGIEGPYNGILQGSEGYEQTTIDREGNAILSEGIKSINAKDGTQIELTIDAGIQSIAEKVLKENVVKQNAKSGSVIIVRPQTGEIIALANYPTFDPTKYYEGEIIDCSLERYKDNYKCKKPEPTPTPTVTPEVGQGTTVTPSPSPTPTPTPTLAPEPPADFSRVFRNNAVSRLFEAGSVIKTLTVAVGIQEGKFTKDSIMAAHPGCENILEDKYVCKWDRNAAPARSIKDAIADSDNLAMKEIAFVLGKETMYKYFTNLGIDSKVNANLDGEEVSKLKTPVEMNKLDLATMSFGQAFNVSPLQVVQAYIPIINDGVSTKLHVIKSFKGDDKIVEFTTQSENSLISAQTSKDVKEVLHYATLHSSARDQMSNLLKKYEVGGKSGTAQIPNENGPGYKLDKVNTSYIAYAPADKPEVLMLVTLEEVNGQVLAGSTAIPMWRDIAEQTFPLMGVKTK